MWFNKATWYWMHLGLQLGGFGLFLAGFIIAFVKFGDGDIMGGQVSACCGCSRDKRDDWV